MSVQEVDAVHVIHDSVAEEHIAVLLGLRQGHTSQVQRVALCPAAVHVRDFFDFVDFSTCFVCLCVAAWFGLLVGWVDGWAS